jgi:hypothetical protein
MVLDASNGAHDLNCRKKLLRCCSSERQVIIALLVLHVPQEEASMV